MTTVEIECPSGLSGTIRPMRVSDMDVFMDRSLRRKAGAAVENELAKRVWVETINRGPYAFDGSVPPWNGDILVGDRFYTVIQSRIAGRGPQYDFDHQCPNCTDTFPWGISLDDLPILRLSEDSLRNFENGNRFTTDLERANTTVTWSLPTGRVQRRADQLTKRHGKGLAIIYAARLIDVPNINPGHFVQWMQGLDIGDFEDLVASMENADCGLDTAIEIACEDCGFISREEVALGRNFFMNSKSLRTSQRPSSATSSEDMSQGMPS